MVYATSFDFVRLVVLSFGFKMPTLLLSTGLTFKPSIVLLTSSTVTFEEVFSRGDRFSIPNANVAWFPVLILSIKDCSLNILVNCSRGVRRLQ